MRRIQNTIALARSSWEVLKADKELLLLPVMSAIATLIVAATFLVPLFFSSGLDADTDSIGPLTYVLLFIAYVVLAYVTIFFNAALIHAANDRLEGGDPTLGSALRGARSRAIAILPWAVVSATVSVILQAIEERAGWLGRVIAGIAGVAWSLVTFLVLPILVVEGIGVGDAIRKSGQMFKRTWGENVAAQVGFGLLGFILVLPAIPLVALGAAAGDIVLGLSILLAVVWVIGVSTVLAAMNGIFQTALYRYARDGHTGGFFPDGTMRGAFE